MNINFNDIYRPSRQHHKARAHNLLAEGFKEHTDKQAQVEQLTPYERQQAQRERMADAMDKRRNQARKDFLGNDIIKKEIENVETF